MQGTCRWILFFCRYIWGSCPPIPKSWLRYWGHPLRLRFCCFCFLLACQRGRSCTRLPLPRVSIVDSIFLCEEGKQLPVITAIVKHLPWRKKILRTPRGGGGGGGDSPTKQNCHCNNSDKFRAEFGHYLGQNSGRNREDIRARPFFSCQNICREC